MTIIAMGPESAGDRAVVISYHPDLLLVAIENFERRRSVPNIAVAL